MDNLHTLPNGLPVLFELDPTQNTVAVALLFRAGSGFEGQAAGAAHFLEHLVFDGTKRYPDKASLSQLIEQRGIRKNGQTNKIRAVYHTEGFPQDLDFMLEYLAELTINPLLRELDVELEKKVINKEIKRSLDNPADYASRKAWEQYFQAGDPQGRFVTGGLKDLEQLSLEQLKQFFQNHYVAKNAVLVVRGSVDPEAALGSVQKWFKEMPAGARQVIPECQLIGQSTLVKEERADLTQVHFRLLIPAFPETDPRSYVTRVIQNSLTGGFSSRLMQRLREQEGLIYSFTGMSVLQPHYGVFGLGTGVDRAALEPTLTAIRAELKALSQDLITEEELKKAINSNTAGLLVNRQANMIQAQIMAYDYLFKGRVVPVAEELAQFEAVTRERVREVAKEIFASLEHLYVLG